VQCLIWHVYAGESLYDLIKNQTANVHIKKNLNIMIRKMVVKLIKFQWKKENITITVS